MKLFVSHLLAICPTAWWFFNFGWACNDGEEDAMDDVDNGGVSGIVEYTWPKQVEDPPIDCASVPLGSWEL